MKKLILNGSPRQGNTVAAINAFMGGGDKDFEIINLKAKKIAPCKACLFCKNEGNCIDKDDTNEVMDKVEEADFILFATPVYWWGVTAQLKLAIDKLYARCNLLQGQKKKIGVIAIGEDELEGPQYRIIEDTFRCIADYLGWDMVFYEPVSAGEKDDLANRPDDLKKIAMLADKVK
ncbi:MAG: flavodoxin family protein [Clostridiales Family XIII bacterium]|nr:flavodoxin family protein [Eubacteriales bacterium]MDY3010919.1 flavodoxin family protein [Clostridiales Family XIII bacterium]